MAFRFRPKGKNLFRSYPNIHRFPQTLQVQLLERLELPDLLADGEELVVAQGQHAQLLEAPDGRGDAAQLVVGQVQGLKKYEGHEVA